MNQFLLSILIYLPLQLAAFAVLPKWWKLTAVPALIAVVGIFDHDGYMGEAFATMGLTFASVYLGVLLALVGIAKWISRSKH